MDTGESAYPLPTTASAMETTRDSTNNSIGTFSLSGPSCLKVELENLVSNKLVRVKFLS